MENEWACINPSSLHWPLNKNPSSWRSSLCAILKNKAFDVFQAGGYSPWNKMSTVNIALTATATSSTCFNPLAGCFQHRFLVYIHWPSMLSTIVLASFSRDDFKEMHSLHHSKPYECSELNTRQGPFSFHALCGPCSPRCQSDIHWRQHQNQAPPLPSKQERWEGQQRY